LLGNAHLLDVASAVLSVGLPDTFFARMLASETRLSDPVVHPCLRRMEAAGVIEAVPSEGRENRYARSDHPFWEFVRELDRLHPPAWDARG
jgi:hypothetical protein